MAEGSNGSTNMDDNGEFDPAGTNHRSDNIHCGALLVQTPPDIPPSSTRDQKYGTAKPDATPDHIITALSIEKSHTIDRNSVEFVFPRELVAPAGDEPTEATSTDDISKASLSSEFQDLKYYCVVCDKLMLDPLEIKLCTHSICEQCFILQSKKKGTSSKCSPEDRGSESHVGLTSKDVYKAKRLKEEIQRRTIYCPNKRLGCMCTSEIVIRNIKEHLLEVCTVARPPDIDDIANNLVSSIQDPHKSQQVRRLTEASTSLLSMVEILQTFSLKVDLAKEKYVLLKDELRKKDLSNSNIMDDVKILQEERTKLESERNLFIRKVGKNDQEIRTLKNSANAWQDAVNPRDPQRTHNLKNRVALMNNTLNDFDLRLQCLENVSYDGKLMWKISNFSEHMQRVDRVESLFSQPFYDSVRGYKMCCRLYLKGRRTRQDTIEDNVAAYISLYFVLMRGTYDDLLAWPFRKTINLTLKHFEEGAQDIEELIVPEMFPDINNPINKEFGKPRTEMNKPVGVQKFLLRTQIDKYVKNDTLYIFCCVKDVIDNEH